MKRRCARLRKPLGPAPQDLAIPVDTAPGEVAQVDFGYVRLRFDPDTQTKRKAWVFLLVLGHSRHLFAKVVSDQRAETWQQLHVEAFAFFGGVPRILVPDNRKAAVIRAAFGKDEDPSLHRGYRERARHCGFKIDPAPPRDPEKMRLPGTTHRRPLEVFEAEEKAALLALPARPHVPDLDKRARVHTDSHVVFDKRLYSVPYRFLHAEAWVKATPDRVAIYREIFAREDALKALRTVQAIVTSLEKHPTERANNAARPRRLRARAHAGGFPVGLQPQHPEGPHHRPGHPPLRRPPRERPVHRARWRREVTAPRLLAALRAGRGDGSYARGRARLADVDRLLSDDLGRMPPRGDEPDDLYELIRLRYERRAIIIITSNRSAAEWPGVFGRDPRAHVAARA